jgi:hypothetical protein
LCLLWAVTNWLGHTTQHVWWSRNLLTLF